ncbi:N-acyl-D-amino-acid deacylase family protein [Phytohabitans rumicis]|uniref:Dihydroorotase n=1 Tax=Phytohabitans rumicis TaxID=1076125 RepID=A0A6V8LPY4_9ACTN|nr:D-aminoacylase [Phytohabitans rumicis]GFJ96306.1 dihydroorotase [Phytohabitans rumicis]
MIVLRGGTVFDGLGAPGVRADVLVADGVIREVGDVPAAAREIDCTGRYVAPGFVDAHAHSDLVPLLPDPQPFKLLQGVTTEINGNCGMSFAPATPSSAPVLAATYGQMLAGPAPIVPSTFAELLDRVGRAGPTNHVAYLVGHHALRLAANGPDADLRPGAAEEMARLAAEAFEAGALGFSTGLIYPPGSFAGVDELTGLAKVAARYGAVYATHMRDEGRHVEEAIDEAVAVARAGGIRLQISHCKAAGRDNHGKAGAVLARIAAARLAGVDAYGDQYPYRAAATMLAALLPTAAGGPAAMARRLADPDQRAALRAQAARGEPGDGIWASSEPAGVHVVKHADASVAGRTLADLAGDADPFDTLCDLVRRDSTAAVVLDLMAEDDVRRIMASPLVGVGSDSGPPFGPAHPRTYGTFPTLLGRYVRETGVLTWPEALRKATSQTARHFGLHGRGAALPGYHADLVVFDPETIGHPGSYVTPDEPVTGIHTVLLAGEPVVEDGQFTGRRAGRVLRRGGS